MKKLVNNKRFEVSIQYLLWALLLFTILYIFYCYLSGLLSGYTQLVTTICITILLLLLLVRYSNLSFSLAVLFGTGYVLMYILWGSIIPFIQFFPFITSYLLNISKNERYIDSVLIFSLLLTTFELLGVLPFYKIEQIEVGIPNLLIILSVQVITYFIWRSILSLYSMLDKINFLGISDLIPNTSKNFLISTLAKGLYISVLFHFFNNFLNSIVWGSQLPDSKLKVLKLFSESDRNDSITRYTLQDITALVGIQSFIQEDNSKPMDLDFSLSDAKELFLLLYNINNNYQKRNDIPIISISATSQTSLRIKFSASKNIVLNKAQIWSRNLGTMKQLLELTGKGTIEIIANPIFTTNLIFSD